MKLKLSNKQLQKTLINYSAHKTRWFIDYENYGIEFYKLQNKDLLNKLKKYHNATKNNRNN